MPPESSAEIPAVVEGEKQLEEKLKDAEKQIEDALKDVNPDTAIQILSRVQNSFKAKSVLTSVESAQTGLDGRNALSRSIQQAFGGGDLRIIDGSIAFKDGDAAQALVEELNQYEKGRKQKTQSLNVVPVIDGKETIFKIEGVNAEDLGKRLVAAANVAKEAEDKRGMTFTNAIGMAKNLPEGNKLREEVYSLVKNGFSTFRDQPIFKEYKDAVRVRDFLTQRGKATTVSTVEVGDEMLYMVNVSFQDLSQFIRKLIEQEVDRSPMQDIENELQGE